MCPSQSTSYLPRYVFAYIDLYSWRQLILPAEIRFGDALKREQSEVIEGERMDETLCEPEADMDIGANPGKDIVPGSSSPGTTCELLRT